MSMPLLTCIICQKPVTTDEAQTNGNRKPVHAECLTVELMVKLSEYVGCGPMDGEVNKRASFKL
jgi:hypothetical protein